MPSIRLLVHVLVALGSSVLSLPLSTRAPYSIQITNKSSQPICYGFEVDAKVEPIPMPDKCGPLSGTIVAAGTSRLIPLPRNFQGAISDFRQGGTVRGARNEFNYQSNGQTWYNIDYEYGISNGLFGPVGGRYQGESDYMAKLHKAWAVAGNKDVLLQNSQYLKGDWAHLTYANVDKAASFEIQYFFQVEAALNGYVYHGSVAGEYVVSGTKLATLKSLADGFSWNAWAPAMEIISY